jgi:hypothetical protein
MSIETKIRSLFYLDDQYRYFFEPTIITKNKHYPRYKNQEEKPNYPQRLISDNISWIAKCNLYRIKI